MTIDNKLWQVVTGTNIMINITNLHYTMGSTILNSLLLKLLDFTNKNPSSENLTVAR